MSFLRVGQCSPRFLPAHALSWRPNVSREHSSAQHARPVLSRGMDRANNIFDQIDTDKSGGLDKGEITIHLLSLGQEQETVRTLQT